MGGKWYNIGLLFIPTPPPSYLARSWQGPGRCKSWVSYTLALEEYPIKPARGTPAWPRARIYSLSRSETFLRLHADGHPICRLQEAFGCAQRTISNIVHHRTHKRVLPVGECSVEHPFDSMTLAEIASVYRAKGIRGHAGIRGLADQGQEALAAMSAGVKPSC